MTRTERECLRLAVDAAGGDKPVGAKLKPEHDPQDAGRWLGHCLAPADAERRERLSIEQIRLIFRMARTAGDHRGFEAFAELCGYRVTAAVTEAEELADMARRAEKAAQESRELTLEVMERMRRAHIKGFE